MKRNILLLFGLIGLVALEYGCTEEPITCGGSSEMRITGISDVEYLVLDSSNQLTELEGNEASYEELRCRIVLDWERLAIANFVNYSAYAVAPPFTNWKPDSIQVFENGEDVSALFTIDGYASFIDYLDSNNQNGNYMYLKLLAAPESEAEKVYTFQLFHSEGNLDVTTKPLLITP